MMDNIIRGVFGRSAEARAEQLENQIARLREIESAGSRRGMGKKGHVFPPSDRRLAAHAIDLLVRSAREQGFSVEQIRARCAERGTSRIDRYRLSVDQDEAAARLSSGKLQAKVCGYLAIAQAIASLTGDDPDATKIGVLAHTSVWSRRGSRDEGADPRANPLALQLSEMGNAVARRTKLKDLFARAARIPGRWDVINETVHPAPMAIPCSGPFLDRIEHWTEAPPLPSVPLVRCVHSLIHFPELRIEKVGRTSSSEFVAVVDDGFEADVRAGWFELSREIRLAIGPATSDFDVVSMFETRAHLRLGLMDSEETYFEVRPACTLKPVDDVTSLIPVGVFEAKIGGTWRRVSTVIDIDNSDADVFPPAEDAFHWETNPLDPHSPTVEHWYFSWAAVNEATVEYWLDRPSGTNNAVSVRHEGPKPGEPVWYSRGSVAYDVEEDLANEGLENALALAVQRVSDAICQREAEWQRTAQMTHETRMARWASESEENGDG